MIGFIVTGHGSFASGLASAVAMVAGEQPEFECVPFYDVSAASYGGELRRVIDGMARRCPSLVIFADLLGGTPFNQAMLATQGLACARVVAGTNLPMLIEALFMRNSNSEISADELVDFALEVGREGVVSKRLVGRDPARDAVPEGGGI